MAQDNKSIAGTDETSKISNSNIERFAKEINKFDVDYKLFKKVTNLDLSSRNLTEIPEYIFFCTELESLTLKDNNNISSLPVEIKNFCNLRILDLTNTNIKEIPKEISQLKLLQELHLNYMQWQYRLDELRKITKARIILE